MKPCIVCGAVIASGSRCAVHQVRNGSTRQWRITREAILRRDGYVCQVDGCGREAVHVDHILAKVNGGSDDPSNLRATCAKHNLEKGGRDIW